MSVYTSLEAADIESFLALHSQGTLAKFSGIAAGIENTNYFVTTQTNDPDKSTKEFVLTLFETTPATTLETYFRLMENLAQQNLPAARPIRTLNGPFLSDIKSKPAVLIERLPGNSVSSPLESHCMQVGSFLAKMHLANRDTPEAIENFRGAGWRETVIHKLSEQCSRDETKLLTKSHTQMCHFEQSSLPKGNVHGDLFHDNALFVAGTLTGVIDFYYAHHAAYIYDLAVAFADWCFVQNNAEVHTDNARAMIKGYTSIRPFSDDEITAWPAAIELASLRFLLSRLHDKYFPRAGSITQEKDPLVFRLLLEKSQQEAEALLALIKGSD